MIYNTTPITNISDKPFTGRFGGVDVVLEPKQKRFLPSHVSTHIAQQLADVVAGEAKRGNSKLDKASEKVRLMDMILGDEIMTERPKDLPLMEEIALHEEEFEKSKSEEEIRFIESKKQILND